MPYNDESFWIIGDSGADEHIHDLDGDARFMTGVREGPYLGQRVCILYICA